MGEMPVPDFEEYNRRPPRPEHRKATEPSDDETPRETEKKRPWLGWLVRVGIGLALVATVAVTGFVVWASNTYGPGPDAFKALKSADEVTVVERDGYEFRPAGDANVGLILYPGARVNPGSYAVVAHRLAEEGFLVVVPELTLNLAVLDTDAADAVMERHPDIDNWVIGGHSLGGAMAATYAADNEDRLAGLVLWGSYPPASTDLTDSSLVTASIYGTLDGLSSVQEVQASGERLPPETTFVAIEGGNHAQFGDYGAQEGDNPATISPRQQWTEIEQGTLDVLSRVESDL